MSLSNWDPLSLDFKDQIVVLNAAFQQEVSIYPLNKYIFYSTNFWVIHIPAVVLVARNTELEDHALKQL